MAHNTDSTAWYDKWYAGLDLDAVRNSDTGNQKSKSKSDHQASLRWAAQQRRGGLVSKLFGR